jgi:hypothetical protein
VADDTTLDDLRRITGETLSLLMKKHADYGTANLDRFGAYGILVRVSDKVARIENLTHQKTLGNAEPEVADETVKDTWRDIAGYAIQAIRLIEKEENRG